LLSRLLGVGLDALRLTVLTHQRLGTILTPRSEAVETH
jgi:hypothetical protein